MNEDLYSVLGVDEGADDVTLKKAYRKLSMKTHPDTPGGGDEEQFKKISGAYEILRDKRKRQEYDMQRNNPMFGQGIQLPPDLFDILTGGFGGISAAGGMTGGLEGIFGGPGPQIFHVSGSIPTPFGEMRMNCPGGREQMRTPMRPSMTTPMGVNRKNINLPPIEKTIDITLQEAFTGKTKQISVSRTVISGMSRKLEKETLYVTIPKGIDTDEIRSLHNFILVNL